MHTHKRFLTALLLVFVTTLALVHPVLPVQAVRDRKALLAIIDSYVLEDQPDANLGWAFSLLVNGYVYSRAVSFLMFNLGELPLSAIIEEATLRLYAAGGMGLKAPVSAYYCASNDWTEDGITYNNMPEFEAEPLDTANITSGLTWYEWHVTSRAQSTFNGADKRLSLALKANTDGGGNFYSRTSPPADLRPELSVLYSYTPSSGVDPVLVGLVAVGILAASAVVLELVFIRRKKRKQTA